MTVRQLLDIALRVSYTNWRGVKGVRSIVPIHIKYDHSKYHSKNMNDKLWILVCYDLNKQTIREFSLKDINFTNL